MRNGVIALVLGVAACGVLSVTAQPPPELEEVQGKYQSALQTIARTYEDQVTDLNRKYVAALHKLQQQLEARGEDEGARLVEAEIEWVTASRDQIPHPWELLDAASEGTPHPAEQRYGAQAGAAGAPVVLGPFWNRSTRGGRTAQKDLQALFDPYVDAGIDLEPAPGLELCQGVTYLMPVEEAIQALGGTREGNARVQVETPGIPERSFYFHACTGDFESRFTTALLVTDAEDKVVAVQFMRDPDAADRQAFAPFMSRDWRLYDLVQYRQKASSDDQVGHQLMFLTETEDGARHRYRLRYAPVSSFERITGQGNPVLIEQDAALRELADAVHLALRIDTLFADGHPAHPSTRLISRTRLYLPRQILRLILQRIGE